VLQKLPEDESVLSTDAHATRPKPAQRLDAARGHPPSRCPWSGLSVSYAWPHSPGGSVGQHGTSQTL